MKNVSRKDFEVTPLVAYGLVFLLLVFGGLGLQKFWRVENSLAATVIEMQSEVASLQKLSGEDVWEGRFEQSLVMRQSVDGALWTGQTTGVIAAQLQQALRSEASKIGFDSIQVRVDPDIIERDGVEVLSFEFAGRAPDGKGIVSLIEAVAVNPKRLIIRDVDFGQNTRSKNRPRLAMGGIIPVRIAAAQAAQPQTPDMVVDSMTGLLVPAAPQRQGQPDPLVIPYQGPQP